MVTPLRDLRTTMTLMVPRKGREGCIPRRKAYGHGGRSIPANDEPAHRFGGSRPGMRPHGLRDQLRGVQRSTSKAADVAVFATVIDGESRTRALDGTRRAQEEGRRERERIRPSKVRWGRVDDLEGLLDVIQRSLRSVAGRRDVGARRLAVAGVCVCARVRRPRARLRPRLRPSPRVRPRPAARVES